MSTIPEPNVSGPSQVSSLTSSAQPQVNLQNTLTKLVTLNFTDIDQLGNIITSKDLIDFDNEIEKLQHTHGINKSKISDAKALLDELCYKLIEHNLIKPQLDIYKSNPEKMQLEKTNLKILYHAYPPASRLNPATVQIGLEKIQNHFTSTTIPGDGHCCFRSIACVFALQMNKDFATMIYNQAIQSINKLATRNEQETAKQALETLKNKIQELIDKKITASQFTHDNTVVACLRTLSTVCNVYTVETNQSTKDALKASVIHWYDQKHKDNKDAEEIKLKAYFSNMQDMHKKEYGTNFEIEALAHLFGIGITAVDARAIGSETAKNPRLDIGHFISNYRLGNPSREKSTGEFYILQRPGHFDALTKIN